jgi:hypothetical protein
MNALLDNSLVGVLLLVSLGYAFYRLGPRTLRKRILDAVSGTLAAAPAFLKLGRVAQRLDAASLAKAQGACGGCDTCGTESASKPQPASAEISIPIAKIGRRA